MNRADIDPEALPDDHIEGRPFPVPDDVAHYLRDVLRLEVGDPVELFDGTGRLLRGPLQQVDERRVVVMVERDGPSERAESPCQITLFQAIPKRKRWRWLLEKATELGVSRIVPVETHHTVVQIPEAKIDRKRERWDKIVASAARQCGRAVTPDVAAPVSLQEGLDAMADGPTFVPSAADQAPTLVELLDAQTSPGGSVQLWIGPEGGFAEREIQSICEAGGRRCRLGPRILRVETATVVATTLVQARLGDLGGELAIDETTD